MRWKRTTGLSPEQFAELCRLVLATVDWPAGCGRPRALTLGQAVKATVMYFKNNITQDVIAELLDVSQPTVSRIIAELEPVIGDVLDDYVPDPDEAVTGLVTLIDGTLTPCWSWADAPELHSGKHHTTGHNHQVVTALDGRLLHVGDPLPGRVHDARAVRDTGLLDTLDVANSIGDKGYLGTGRSPPTANPRAGNCWTGRRHSTRRSTRCAPRSNARYPTSKPGAPCTPTTADPSAPTPPHSTPSAPYTSSNCVLNKTPSLAASAPRSVPR